MEYLINKYADEEVTPKPILETHLLLLLSPLGQDLSSHDILNIGTDKSYQ